MQYLRCPNCGSTTLWIECDGKMVFIRVCEDGTLEPAREGKTIPDGCVATRVNCTSCSWYGDVSELAR